MSSKKKKKKYFMFIFTVSLKPNRGFTSNTLLHLECLISLEQYLLFELSICSIYGIILCVVRRFCKHLRTYQRGCMSMYSRVVVINP